MQSRFLKECSRFIVSERLSRVLLYTAFLIFFLFAFTILLFGSPNVQDGAGHIDLALNIKNNLWPDYTGWNPNYLMGFQQGLFYPPLFHYLLAALMFVFSPLVACSMLLAALIVIFPFSVHFFSRKIAPDRVSANFLTIIILAGWFLVELFSVISGIGIDPLSTFNTGLYPAFLFAPLFFFFLGSLEGSLRTGKWALSSILLALLMIAHFTGIAAAIIVLACILVNPKKSGALIKILFFGLAMSAFWWLPLLANSFLIPKTFFPFSIPYELIAVCFAGLLCGIAIKSRLAKAAAISSGLLLAFWEFWLAYGLPFQFYRFFEVIFILSTIPIGAFFFEKKYRKIIAAGTILGVAAIIFFSPVYLTVNSFSSVQVQDTNKLDGQTLVLRQNTSSQNYPQVYIGFSEQTGSKSLEGLFSESAPVSELVCLFAVNLDVQTPCWGVRSASQSRQQLPIFWKQVDALNINYLIASNDPPRLPDYESKKLFLVRADYYPQGEYFFVPAKQETYYQQEFLYKISSNPQVELPKQVASVNMNYSDWTGFVRNWFENSDTTIYVLNSGADSFPYDPKASVGSFYEDKDWQSFSFTVDSNEKVPVLVKESWSPNWRAFDSSGKELPIYMASPYSMLVVGNGKIFFKNERTTLELGARLISVIALVGLIIIMLLALPKKRGFMKKNQKKVKNKLFSFLNWERAIFLLVFFVLVAAICIHFISQPAINSMTINDDSAKTKQFLEQNPAAVLNSSGDTYCDYNGGLKLFIYGNKLLVANGANAFFSENGRVIIDDFNKKELFDSNKQAFFDSFGLPNWCQLNSSKEHGFYDALLNLIETRLVPPEGKNTLA